MNDYYVYEHIRLDNNTCFYVGKGHGKRAYQKNRNELHDRVANKFGMKVKIIRDNLNEYEAYQLEELLIKHYVYDLGYGIAIDGYRKNNDHYLTNHTFGGDGSYGMVHSEQWCNQHSLDMMGDKNPMYGVNIWDKYTKEDADKIKKKLSEKFSNKNNPMYGISPKDRMDKNTYEEWLTKTKNRLKNQTGENNPNYGNDVLKKKLELNPELKIEYYSRKGSQNGRATPIEVYDSNHNLIKEFSYIGECCKWMRETLGINTKTNSLRGRIRLVARTQSLYKNMYFKYK